MKPLKAEAPVKQRLTLYFGDRCVKGEGLTFTAALENALVRPRQYLTEDQKAWILQTIKERKKKNL